MNKFGEKLGFPLISLQLFKIGFKLILKFASITQAFSLAPTYWKSKGCKQLKLQQL